MSDTWDGSMPTADAVRVVAIVGAVLVAICAVMFAMLVLVPEAARAVRRWRNKRKLLARLLRQVRAEREDTSEATRRADWEFRQRGTVQPSIAEIIALIGVAVLSASLLVGGLALIGYRLLTPAQERDEAERARMWREKRRELNASVEARKVRT